MTDTWFADALCLGLDPELFFPVSGENSTDAKAVCRVCPVQAECLEYALVNVIKMGVWGGLSERERRPLRVRRARAS